MSKPFLASLGDRSYFLLIDIPVNLPCEESPSIFLDKFLFPNLSWKDRSDSASRVGKPGSSYLPGKSRQAYCSYCVLPKEKKRLST